MKLACFKVGQLPGSLKEQVDALRHTPTKELEDKADFKWQFDCSLDCPKGRGQLVIVPPGWLTVRACKSFVGVKWHFGARTDDSVNAVHASLTSLFESFPALKKGAYEGFFTWLETKKVPVPVLSVPAVTAS